MMIIMGHGSGASVGYLRERPAEPVV